MSTVILDIEKFNQYVKVNVDGLKARGDFTYDLVINLFKAYQVASEGGKFRYIKKGDQLDDGNNIYEDELMTSDLKKIEILLKDNKWNSIYPKQEQKIAPTSVVEILKDNKRFKNTPPR